jgi:hypothetical protein
MLGAEPEPSADAPPAANSGNDYDHEGRFEKGMWFQPERLAMIRSFTFCAAFISLCSLAGADQPTDDFADYSLSLYDGETIAGWEGNAYWFRIEGDSIVAGRLDEPIPHNEFLCTTQNYDNFELRLEVKLVGEGQNAGVQFRSQRVAGGSEVSGYQADIGFPPSSPVWGSLYDESRRRKMLAEPDPERVKKSVARDDWNKLRVICKGSRIQIFVNGEQTVDYTETDAEIPKHGVIGLQIHSGKPSEAWYRNIRIRQL